MTYTEIVMKMERAHSRFPPQTGSTMAIAEWTMMVEDIMPKISVYWHFMEKIQAHILQKDYSTTQVMLSVAVNGVTSMESLVSGFPMPKLWRTWGSSLDNVASLPGQH